MSLLDPPSLRLHLGVRNGHNATSAGMGAQAVLTKNINSWLRFTRRSQAELAEHLRVSQPYVSLLLNGKRDWQIEMLDALAEFFCVTVPLLFADGDGEHLDRRTGHERRHHERRNGDPTAR